MSFSTLGEEALFLLKYGYFGDTMSPDEVIHILTKEYGLNKKEQAEVTETLDKSIADEIVYALNPSEEETPMTFLDALDEVSRKYYFLGNRFKRSTIARILSLRHHAKAKRLKRLDLAMGKVPNKPPARLKIRIQTSHRVLV